MTTAARTGFILLPVSILLVGVLFTTPLTSGMTLLLIAAAINITVLAGASAIMRKGK